MRVSIGTGAKGVSVAFAVELASSVMSQLPLLPLGRVFHGCAGSPAMNAMSGSGTDCIAIVQISVSPVSFPISLQNKSGRADNRYGDWDGQSTMWRQSI
ncbi:hypothetical protein [Pseudomonas alvandae]|uniref:Uncharacterized protein n=1 Tax=Pseudomonas canavaninivorans TaxID=2842348 RepID=A0ABX8Q7K8_PSECO|nr:hypothetical protein [Pseudomonas alvandae]QXI50727.1 hypothetical protein KSS97_14270 [Pseudomonas alvandae]